MARPWVTLGSRDYVRLHEALLVDMVRRFLYPFSPFYRRLFDEHGIKPRHIRKLRDIEKIPLVSRDDFEESRDDPAVPVAAPPGRANLRAFGSSSAGPPGGGGRSSSTVRNRPSA